MKLRRFTRMLSDVFAMPSSLTDRRSRPESGHAGGVYPKRSFDLHRSVLLVMFDYRTKVRNE
jgi:hypothetical protein